MSDLKLQFKCPSCGSVEGIEFDTYLKCRHCGNRYEKELLDGAVYADLSYAVNERQEADFDRARRKYDALIERYHGGPGMEEAYWGRFLCEQYVIFYQNDVGDSIPSFWNVNEDPCQESESYKMAIKYGAQSGNLDNYERLAEQIEEYKHKYRRVKEEIPEGSQVFICFKDSGTKDGRLGYRIFNTFARKYNIFFSKESLNNIQGNDYEPYIYHALTTAKVLILLCSDRDHLESKWVHNEWWRFWKFAKGTDKAIIPVFRNGFDPSQLPDEIRNCQGVAEDISLISILSERLEHILNPEREEEKRQPITFTGTPKIEPLLRRATLFLEDGDRSSANEYCERVLDIDPECVDAYLCKLCIDLGIRRRENLYSHPIPYDENINYKKALRFAPKELAEKLQTYNDNLRSRLNQERLEGIYRGAKAKMTLATSEDDFLQAGNAFREAEDYEDAAELAVRCFEKAELARQEAVFETACNRMLSHTVEEYEQAIREFESIPKHKDVDEKISECRAQLRKLDERYRIKRMGKAAVAGFFVLILLAVVALIGVWVSYDKEYKDAINYLAEEQIDEALAIFDRKGNYRDSAEFAKICRDYQKNYFSGFVNHFEMTSFNVPSGATYLSDGSFLECHTLEYVTIPDSVTVIGNQAFERCYNLRTVSIPQSVTKIGHSAFKECTSLKQANLHEGLTELKKDTFNNCNNLSEVTGTDGLTKVGDNAFYCCTELKAISLNGVVSVGNRAFYECYNIESAHLGPNVTSIGEEAFFQCDSMETLRVMNPAPAIGNLAFENCYWLTNVCASAHVISHLYTDNIRTVELVSDGTGVMPDLVNTYYIEKLTLPAGMPEISGNVFSNYGSLRELSIPQSVIYIDENTMNECYALETILYQGSFADWEQITMNPSLDFESRYIVIHGNAASRVWQ